MQIYVKTSELHEGHYHVPNSEKWAKFNTIGMANAYRKAESEKLENNKLKSKTLWYDEAQKICRDYNGENFFGSFEKPTDEELAFNIDDCQKSGTIFAFDFDQLKDSYKELYKDTLLNKADSSNIKFLMDSHGQCFCEKESNMMNITELNRMNPQLIITPDNFDIILTSENLEKIGHWEKEVKESLPQKTSMDLKERAQKCSLNPLRTNTKSMKVKI